MLPHTSKQQFSEAGTVTLTSASGTVTGDFVAIQMLEDTEFDTLVDLVEFPASDFGGTGGKLADSQTYESGTVIYGRFTEIEVDSGTVRVTLASRPFA